MAKGSKHSIKRTAEKLHVIQSSMCMWGVLERGIYVSVDLKHLKKYTT